MGIREEIAKNKAKQVIPNNTDAVLTKDTAERAAIRKLQWQPWYQVLKDYWGKKAQMALLDLRQIKLYDVNWLGSAQQFGAAQEKLNIAEEFLQFLSDRE